MLQHELPFTFARPGCLRLAGPGQFSQVLLAKAKRYESILRNVTAVNPRKGDVPYVTVSSASGYDQALALETDYSTTTDHLRRRSEPQRPSRGRNAVRFALRPRNARPACHGPRREAARDLAARQRRTGIPAPRDAGRHRPAVLAGPADEEDDRCHVPECRTAPRQLDIMFGRFRMYRTTPHALCAMPSQ